jgi:hypothetical protein
MTKHNNRAKQANKQAAPAKPKPSLFARARSLAMFGCLGVVILAVVVGGGFWALGWWLGQAPQASTNQFFTAIQRDDMAAAMALTTPAFALELNMAGGLQGYLTATGVDLAAWRFTSNSVNFNQTSASVYGNATYGDGAVYEFTVQLEQINGAWLVSRFSFT